MKRYSSGMYVRLAFAVAAHLEPEILIVDEVLAVGDAQFQKKCLGKMHDVARDGRTVLFVSHQLGVLKELCSSGVLLNGGRSQFFPQIEAAIKEYLGGAGDQAAPLARKSRYIEAVAFGSNNKSKSHIFFGEELKIAVWLRELPPIRVGVNISIRNDSGRLLTLFSTNPHDGVQLPVKNELKVTFCMDFCCFTPGRYFLDVAVTEPAVRIIEEMSNAIAFEILPRSIGGHLPYEARYGDVFPPHSWQAEEI